jgi:hypothetical protein
MNRKRQLFVASVIAGSMLVAGAVTDKLLTPPRAQAREVAGQDLSRKWEYCALSKAAYLGPSRAGVHWINYFQENGVRVVEVEASATEGGGAAFAKAISRLGSEGWEMVAPGQIEVNQGQTGAIYFKRPKQLVR